jgi:hypothetical protein
VRISIWQLISKIFMAAAIAAFTAFHFIRDPDQNSDRGWTIWKNLWDLLLNPSSMSEPMGWVAIASFLSASLMIVVSPFLGRVWIKSKMAWLPAVIFSGIAAVGFTIAILLGKADHDQPIGWGMILLMAAPVLNFIGLLLARTGASPLDTSRWTSDAPSSPPEEL